MKSGNGISLITKLFILLWYFRTVNVRQVWYPAISGVLALFFTFFAVGTILAYECSQSGAGKSVAVAASSNSQILPVSNSLAKHSRGAAAEFCLLTVALLLIFGRKFLHLGSRVKSFKLFRQIHYEYTHFRQFARLIFPVSLLQIGVSRT